MSASNGTGAGRAGLAGMSGDELRAAVRAVLREVLPAEVRGAQPATGTAGAAGAAGTAGGSVTIRTDADLDALVRTVAAACADPAVRDSIAAGRHAFRLAGATEATGASGATEAAEAAEALPAAQVLRIERGAVTERTVLRAAKDGARLVLGRAAVLTPLARDKARSLGVPIEKEA